MGKILRFAAIFALLMHMILAQQIACAVDNQPKEATLRPGEKIDFGKYQARLLEVYPDAKNALMEIMDGTGTSFAQKKLAQGDSLSYNDSDGAGLAVQATFVSNDSRRYVEVIACAYGAPPSYALLYPENGATLKQREIAFRVRYDKGDFGNASASCYLLVDGKKIGPTTVPDREFGSISVDGLSSGDYSWRMECDGKQTESRRFTKEEGKPPSIALVAPPGGFVSNTGDVRMIYIYKAGDSAPQKVSCELDIGVFADRRDEAASGDSIIAQKLFPAGNYTWKVKCGSGQYAVQSDERRIESRALGPEGANAGKNAADAQIANDTQTYSGGNNPTQPAYLIAPDTVEAGEKIEVRLLYENATPVAGEKIALVGADGKAEAILLTDSKGYATFAPKNIGVYSYEVPLFGIGNEEKTQVMKNAQNSTGARIANAPASELAIIAIIVFAAAGAGVFFLIKSKAKPEE